MKKYGALVPMQTVAKDFGVTKKDIKVMIDTGILQGIPAGEKVYITSQSIYSILEGEIAPLYYNKNAKGFSSDFSTVGGYSGRSEKSDCNCNHRRLLGVKGWGAGGSHWQCTRIRSVCNDRNCQCIES